MSVRKVVTRRGRRIRGYFPSFKCGRMIAWESLLERDAILLLEFSQGVVSYEHQPTVINYSDGEQARKYYPDFEVVLVSGEVVHLEIKPEAELRLPDVEAKYQVVAADYQRRQHRFRILTEADIRIEPLLCNLNTLFPLRGKPAQSEFSVHEWLSTLGTRWLSQEWQISEESLGSLANATYLAAPRDLLTFTEPQQRIAQLRMQYIQKVDPENTPYNVEIWRSKIIAAAQELNDANPPCPATVQIWWRRYFQSRSILSLIPHNKPSSGPRSRPRFQIFEDVLAQVYLTDQKQPKVAVVEAVFRQVDAVNQSLPAEQRIRRPGRATIYRWLDALQQDLVDVAREGAEAARFKYRAALGSVKVSRVLERIEIDHTPLDLIVIDTLTKLPLGRPWLTLAIDAHSRMVMGFYISFNPPSSYSVLQCLRRAMLPKDLWLQRFPDIKGIWPAFGIPELIAVDNGTDLHSDAVEAACLEMGIQILFCGSKTPQHKGAIERFFRTMNMGLIHRLPGTVFSNVDERGDYPAECKSVIDMHDLVHLLTKWIVDIYNVSVHRGIKARPLDVWLESAGSRIIELPLHPAQLEVIVGIPAKRTLFHYGIELDGLQYNSEPLQMLRRRTGQNQKVDLKYYDDTVGHIHVFDPVTKEYIKVSAKLQDYADNLQRGVHRLIRAHARKKHGDHCLPAQLLEARAEIEALVKEAIKSKKMGVRKSGAGYLGHDSDAIISGQDPLLQARQPIKQSKPTPPEDLPSGLDDDLPDFSDEPEGDQ